MIPIRCGSWDASLPAAVRMEKSAGGREGTPRRVARTCGGTSGRTRRSKEVTCKKIDQVNDLLIDYWLIINTKVCLFVYV